MQRIGVFVCWCGSNIAATVDVKAVSEALGHEPGVVFSTNYQYMCSEAGQNIIKDAIKEHHLTGVVICSCSPRMHEATFRKTVAAAGLNSYMLEVANIREQCSWIHKDKAEATEKAIILGRAAIAKVQLNAPLTAGESPVTKRALVIGGGIAGIQTALDIADAGFEVDIVEKQPTIGGKMTQIDKNPKGWLMTGKTKMPPCGARRPQPKNILSPPANAEPTTQAGMTRRGSAAAKGMAPSVIKHAPIIKFATPDCLSFALNLFRKTKTANANANGGTMPPAITAAMI